MHEYMCVYIIVFKTMVNYILPIHITFRVKTMFQLKSLQCGLIDVTTIPVAFSHNNPIVEIQQNVSR